MRALKTFCFETIFEQRNLQMFKTRFHSHSSKTNVIAVPTVVCSVPASSTNTSRGCSEKLYGPNNHQLPHWLCSPSLVEHTILRWIVKYNVTRGHIGVLVIRGSCLVWDFGFRALGVRASLSGIMASLLGVSTLLLGIVDLLLRIMEWLLEVRALSLELGAILSWITTV